MKPFDYSTIKDDPFYRRFGVPAAWALPLFYKPLRISGTENIPLSGALIVACNHINSRDAAPIMAAAINTREIRFMAKDDLFDNPLVAYFFRRMGTFPVKRGIGARPAMDYARRLLEDGRAVGIFPEGARSPDGTPQEPRTGIAKLAQQTGADILPAAVYSPLRGSFGQPITLRFGELIPNGTIDFGDGRSQGRRSATAQIMGKIVKLWEQLRDEHTGRLE
ncbi:MAG: 1-acyl-sn-glycerol-3-phosphate acyltransferase [Oscillospiraceae bacterium]|jgi:1-acyl-sn-glycerol-3-phosphate acyltransferase|nr:1-acyl-sn-glycerol-3-phosphate acyltransferase [Oscillospiraceae bacterium]